MIASQSSTACDADDFPDQVAVVALKRILADPLSSSGFLGRDLPLEFERRNEYPARPSAEIGIVGSSLFIPPIMPAGKCTNQMYNCTKMYTHKTATTQTMRGDLGSFLYICWSVLTASW